MPARLAAEMGPDMRETTAVEAVDAWSLVLAGSAAFCLSLAATRGLLLVCLLG